MPTTKEAADEDEDNPFLDAPEVPAPPKDWSRGGMGFVVTPTTHFIRSGGTRISAYGIGVEVEIDIDKDMAGGMAAMARWTADAESRKTQFRSKLGKWFKVGGRTFGLHSSSLSISSFSCTKASTRARTCPRQISPSYPLSPRPRPH